MRPVGRRTSPDFSLHSVMRRVRCPWVIRKASRETQGRVSRDLQVKMGEQQYKSRDRFAWSKTGRAEDDPHRERRGWYEQTRRGGHITRRSR